MFKLSALSWKKYPPVSYKRRYFLLLGSLQLHKYTEQN